MAGSTGQLGGFLGAHLAYGLGVGLALSWAAFGRHRGAALPAAAFTLGPAPAAKRATSSAPAGSGAR